MTDFDSTWAQTLSKSSVIRERLSLLTAGASRTETGHARRGAGTTI